MESATRSTAEAPPEFFSVVSNLIGAAVAHFDSDRAASRTYLVRASAILQACATPKVATIGHALRKGGLVQWKLSRIVDYIEAHFTEKITVEQLAAQIDVSVGQLFRAFKASLGVSPLQYVSSRRLQYASVLLRTTQLPLSQVAVNAGFCDQSHFCRAFRRAMGLTPAAWRRENAVAPETRLHHLQSRRPSCEITP